jgi:NADH-quinone oxidoreductase subunit J
MLPDGKAAPSSISGVLEARGDMMESKKFEMKPEKEEE